MRTVRRTQRIFRLPLFTLAILFSSLGISHAGLFHYSIMVEADSNPSEVESELILSSTSKQPRKKPLAAGTWGGQHVSMEVTASRTTIEYDCAHATIDQKIALDREGRFDVSGTQFAERGGPVRQDSESAGYPARFAGQVSRGVMTLKVTNSESKEVIGTFRLVHGQQARLMKCK
jgi:hypothetical protein